MNQPLLYECDLDQLTPELRRLGETWMDPDDQVILAYEQVVGCDRSAFILTNKSVVCVSFPTNEINKKAGATVKSIPFTEICYIRERCRNDKTLFQAFLIEIYAGNPKARLVTLPFFIMGDGYRKFIKILFDLIEMNQPGYTVGNRITAGMIPA